MKTTAFILGVLSLFTFASCKCDPDEDEPRNKYPQNKGADSANKKGNSQEHNTLSIR